MTRVLILTASYGSGHNEAARSLAAAFAAEGADAIVVDHFRELVHPLFERASRAVYLWLLRRAPAVWAAAYEAGDRMASDGWSTLGVTRLGAGRLARLLERLAPDAVVSTHATPAVAMSSLVANGARRLPPHTTVVTDFVAHSQWIARHIDRYCVAAEAVAHEFVARSIPRDRVLVTGVPVRAEFEERVDPLAARHALGLSPGRPVVLAMAGSHGALGRLPDVVRALARAERPLQGLVIAGRDEPLAARLAAQAGTAPIRVLGYARHVRQLMAAADLLITKAGGMTIAEAMAAEVPLLLYGSLPGQERRNERFATRAGIALVARSRAELTRGLERALADPDLLDDMRQRMRRQRCPDAARRIAGAVLAGASLAP